MRGLILALAAVLGPPGEAPSLGIAWRADQGEVDPALREALRDELSEHVGVPLAAILDDALGQARVVVAHQHDRGQLELHRQARAGLDAGDAAYRAGDFEGATQALTGVLESLWSSPQTPGAPASAREAHLLLAKIAWARGETQAAQLALGDALRLDPEARLSTREAPPGLVERYLSVQAELLAGRSELWATPGLSWSSAPGPEPSFIVEIDGVPGLRPVAPGHHFFVLRREGYAPIAAWRSIDREWEIPVAAEQVPTSLEHALGATCAVLELDRLVLAEHRGDRVGLEVHHCGRGSGPLWTGTLAQLEVGIERALVDPLSYATGVPSMFGVWPVAVVEFVGATPAQREPVPRPWYRKGWIWGTSVGAVALISGAVAAGVLAGAAGPASIEVDADTFIGGS